MNFVRFNDDTIWARVFIEHDDTEFLAWLDAHGADWDCQREGFTFPTEAEAILFKLRWL